MDQTYTNTNKLLCKWGTHITLSLVGFGLETRLCHFHDALRFLQGILATRSIVLLSP